METPWVSTLFWHVPRKNKTIATRGHAFTFGYELIVLYSLPITVKSKLNFSIPVAFAATDKVKVN